MPQLTDVISPFLNERNSSFYNIRKGQMTFIGFHAEGYFKKRCTFTVVFKKRCTFTVYKKTKKE